MYIFVFSWTPTLEEGDARLPHDIVFASFMVACMIGSSVFKLQKGGDDPGGIAAKCFAVGMVALAIPALTSNTLIRLLSFLVFEVCVGMYFPAIGMQRGKVIPDEVRSTIMNFFRIPLNVIVVLILLRVGDMSVRSISLSCSVLLGICAALQTMVNKRSEGGDKEEAAGENEVLMEEGK